MRRTSILASIGNRLPNATWRLAVSYATPRINSWRGRAFEKLCLWHVPLTDICEMKYSNAPYVLDEEEWQRIRARMETYRQQTKTNKGIRLVIVAAKGLKANAYGGAVQSVVTLDSLFL